MESEGINGKSGPLVAQRACHKKRKCGYTQGSANIWAPTHAHTHTPSHSLADLTDRLKLIGQVLLGGPQGSTKSESFAATCGETIKNYSNCQRELDAHKVAGEKEN